MSKFAASRSFQIALGIVSAAVIISPLFPTFAQDSSSSATGRGVGNTRLIVPTANIKGGLSQDKLDALKIQIASREANLKNKLAAFKDQNKAQIAQRISDTLNMINKKRTDDMTKHLGEMTTILDRVDKMNNPPSASGSAQIATARLAITTAQNAVDAQALKDYTLTITSESTVRASAKADRDKLFADLAATRNLVISAKQSIANAIKAVEASKGGEASASASQ